MKRCVVLGNCQAEALPQYLKQSEEFRKFFEILEVPGIYKYSPEDFLYNFSSAIASADLLIYQPLSDRFGLLSERHLKSIASSACDFVTIPSLFFTGYNPEVAYVRDGTLRSIDYVDRNLWNLCLNDTDYLFKKQLESNDYFPVDFSDSCIRLTISESKSREIKKGYRCKNDRLH